VTQVVGQPMDQSKSRVGEDSELEGTEKDPCADSVTG